MVSVDSGVDWPRVEQSGDAGQDGDERKTRGADGEAAGTIAEQPAPGPEPAEAALHYRSAFEDDKARASGVALDEVMVHAVHAVKIAPLPAAFSEEGPVQDRLAPARPSLLTGR